jgi:exo-beta-1,3-glucanase (GH17 family)
MNFLQTAYAAVLIGLSSNAYAAVNGINYDPAHSDDWKKAQQNNDTTTMNRVFDNDLKQIKAMGFTIIKTYYSKFCPQSGQNCINPAQKANDNGLKILLGVFEFSPQHGCFDANGNHCRQWTKDGVDAAIAAAKSYPNTVIGIVVGNEDMYLDRGPDNKPRFKPDFDMQENIVGDIKTIKGPGQVSVPVTTAQRQGDWCGGLPAPGCDPERTNSLNQNGCDKNGGEGNETCDPHNVLGTITIIGANIFPYWGGVPEKIMPSQVSVASKTQSTAQDLLTKLQTGHSNITGVIVTEEGWPSCRGNGQFTTDISEEIDYFTTWSQHTGQAFDSYYFMAYDLGSSCNNGGAAPVNDADKHFGLCSASGSIKDAGLASCPPASTALGKKSR